MIERELGVKSPTEDSECEQQDRYADGEMTIAGLHITVVAVVHSYAASPSVYERYRLIEMGRRRREDSKRLRSTDEGDAIARGDGENLWHVIGYGERGDLLNVLFHACRR